MGFTERGFEVLEEEKAEEYFVEFFDWDVNEINEDITLVTAINLAKDKAQSYVEGVRYGQGGVETDIEALKEAKEWQEKQDGVGRYGMYDAEHEAYMEELSKLRKLEFEQALADVFSSK